METTETLGLCWERVCLRRDQKNRCSPGATVKKLLKSPPPSHPRPWAGQHVTALQSGSDAGSRVPRHEGEQRAVSQGEAEAQREDQQRRTGAGSVAERRPADPHLHQRLQEHERLSHEEGEQSKSALFISVIFHLVTCLLFAVFRSAIWMQRIVKTTRWWTSCLKRL